MTTISLDAFDSAAAIVGRTGSGKTFAAKGVVERLLDDGRRVCIIDPTGAWWGLRATQDMSAKAYDVLIFGSDHADVPLDETSGERLGEIIASGKIDRGIVDVSEMSTAAQIRFLTPFFEALYTGNRGALHLVLDEADLMAPQNPLPETRRLQGVVNKIVRRGRIKGFRPLMITQRPQVIDKSVLSQVDTLIAMRLTAPQDRKAILAWVQGHAGDAAATAAIDSLPGLKVGTGIVWRPSDGALETVSFPMIKTFDSSRAPMAGEEPAKPMAIDRPDLDALRAELAPPTVAQIMKRSRGRVEIMPAVDTAEIKAEAERRGYVRGRESLLGEIAAAISIVDQVEATLLDAAEKIEEAQRWLMGVGSTLLKASGDAPSLSSIVDRAPDNVPARQPQPPKRQPVAPAGKPGPRPVSTLTGPQAVLLCALAWWKAMGHKTPSRMQVAAIAGWTPKGSNLRNRLSELKTADLVEFPAAGLVRMTAAGAVLAPDPDMSVTLLDSIRAVLTGPQRQIFEVLVRSASPMSSRGFIAQAIGWEPDGSNLRNRLSELSQLEIVEYPQHGFVALQPWVK